MSKTCLTCGFFIHTAVPEVDLTYIFMCHAEMFSDANFNPEDLGLLVLLEQGLTCPAYSFREIDIPCTLCSEIKKRRFHGPRRPERT